MTPTPAPKIGDIVRYRMPAGSGGEDLGGDFHMAAIVTMTPAEWTPGYRSSDDEWHETVGVAQPKAGTVHLHVFYPPTVAGAAAFPSPDVQDIAPGDGPGTYSA